MRAIALALGVSVLSGSLAVADGDGPESPGRTRRERKSGLGLLGGWNQGCGTLGYGPPGLHPGFQGFGLGYHPGYGYGGDALGVGAEGGYPFYGGPGYPHPWPRLRRFGGITPFAYDGGPGSPSPGHPNYFGGVGPLVADRPIVRIGSVPGEADYASGYGCFTGAVPYPESVMAPFTTRAAAIGTSSGVSTPGPDASAPDARLGPPSPSLPPATRGGPFELPAPSRSIGIDAEPVVDAGGARGLKVTLVYPATVAEKAGLQIGDVILAINGYRTEQQAHLAWIIANASPDRVLTMTVRSARVGKKQTITARLP